MSDTEQTEFGTTAVRAVAAAAASGAATYAVRKALAARNGSDEDQRDEVEAKQEDPEDSAAEDDEDSKEDEAEASAAEDDEEAGPSEGKGALLRLVNPSRLAGASDLLLPLAASAADSAGRYVAGHTSDTVQQEVVDRFVDAYKKAS
jgi:hypothetical protein